MANILHIGKIYHTEKPFFVLSCHNYCLCEKYTRELKKIDKQMARLRRKIYAKSYTSDVEDILILDNYIPG